MTAIYGLQAQSAEPRISLLNYKKDTCKLMVRDLKTTVNSCYYSEGGGDVTFFSDSIIAKCNESKNFENRFAWREIAEIKIYQVNYIWIETTSKYRTLLVLKGTFEDYKDLKEFVWELRSIAKSKGAKLVESKD